MDGDNNMRLDGLNELREQGRMTWLEAERGWLAAPDDVVETLSKDGFIAIDGQPLRHHAFDSLERDPYADEGGES